MYYSGTNIHDDIDTKDLQKTDWKTIIIVYRADGDSDRPDNLVVSSPTCNKGHHNDTVDLPAPIKMGIPFREIARMNIICLMVVDKVLSSCSGKVSVKFGYIAKSLRLRRGLPKTKYTLNKRQSVCKTY